MKQPRESKKKVSRLNAAPLQASPSPDRGRGQVENAVAFPIVGIGASAGGLEALELFFKNVPEGCGMAFVVIQHLDPTQKGMMVELIQRTTVMPVMQAEDNRKLLPDHVYIIPSNKDLSLLNGILFLFTPSEARGLRLPIDFFFRSLADDQGARSIGVILSGMGSDGLLGLRAIKERGGVGLAQEPASAKFDSMPKSIIEAGLADIVAPAEELPERIITYLQYAPAIAKTEAQLKAKSRSSLEKAVILLRAKTGNDFSQYKKNTVYRRIERRMGLHKIDKIATYLRFLQENPQEVELLSKELLIGVTSFFRDPAAWELLRDEVMPSLFAAYPEGGVLRAWTAGCSTGEEAYSLAIIFREALEKIRPTQNYSLQIFATDLDHDAIDKARAGHYPANILSDVSLQRLNRYFVQDDRGYGIGKDIRETVVFAPHNIIKDPPFTKLDILVCRNLLIYFDQDLQKKLMPLFHYSLNPGGIIFLGSAETVGTFTDLFSPLDVKHRIYRSHPGVQRIARLDFSPVVYAATITPATETHEISTPNIQALMDQFLLNRYAPAAVLTNKDGDILHISGRTGKYLEPAVGKANLNIFAMAREGLRFELQSAFHQAIREESAVTLDSLAIENNGGQQCVNVTVHPLGASHALQGMLIVVFVDLHAPLEKKKSRKKSRNTVDDILSADLRLKLMSAREELQSSREQMQASQEELRSTNEELQSTNEELQSTNEELTTSKEEMQSMNEELQTVNSELRTKIDELSRTNNDMKNLLNSTDIATLFLDEDLHVRRFTNHVTSIINLIPGDIGRPITNITTILDYPEMAADAKEVLRTLVFCEKSVSTQDGQWFLVRILPYRTLDNRIDGVVITFMDISMAKDLEALLREKEQDLKLLFEKMPVAFVLFHSVFDGDGNFISCRFGFVNEAYERVMGEGNAAVAGKSVQEGWPNFTDDVLKVFEKVVETGISDRIEFFNNATEVCYECLVYRPSAKKSNFCCIFHSV